MNDDELINYCNIHARTERALFSKEHVERMFVLAGHEKPVIDTDFMPMKSAMLELVGKAKDIRENGARRHCVAQNVDQTPARRLTNTGLRLVIDNTRK